MWKFNNFTVELLTKQSNKLDTNPLYVLKEQTINSFDRNYCFFVFSAEQFKEKKKISYNRDK